MLKKCMVQSWERHFALEYAKGNISEENHLFNSVRVYNNDNFYIV